jgi:hypothetical protein
VDKMRRRYAMFSGAPVHLIGGPAGLTPKVSAPPNGIAQSFSYHASKGNLTPENGMVGLPEWKPDTDEVTLDSVDECSQSF